MPVLLALVLTLALGASLPAQPREARPQPAAEATAPADRAERRSSEEAAAIDETPVETRHEVRVGGRLLRYTATTGMMPIRGERGETDAHIFYIAYTLVRPAGSAAADRPLMFSFNGGPGSSSVWLHMGTLGPRRVRMEEEGWLPAAPYQLEDNEHSWLDLADLVFIDPVGTGYSRPATRELGRKFWGVRGDIESIGEFIRLYITRNERWASPLFLIGESYGTTRAAGLAGHLVDRGIAFNGVLLVSSVLNFQTVRFRPGNDLPYVLYLPTYAATAWYHRRLPPDLQQMDLRSVLDEVEAWALEGYTVALARGDRLQDADREAVVERLARYTGLDPQFIEGSNLRVEIMHFCKELLRDARRTVGRLDSRFQGMDALAVTERFDFDPSMAAIRPPYTAMFNEYVRTELGYQTDLTYHILGGGIGPWDWGSARDGFPDTSDALRSAFAKNPHMQVWVASGYYDLATPYFATEYTLAHMGLDPAVREQVSVDEYEAGHMMYIQTASLEKFKRDGEAFFRRALARQPAAVTTEAH